MLKIAITGNIACGKSEVEEFLGKQGFSVLDTDKAAHALSESNIEIRKKIYEKFKTNDRTEIGKIVFSNPELKQELEDILHPPIKKRIEDFFDSKKFEKAVFVSVPLLYEAGWESMFDKVILVAASDDIRLSRLMKRNNFSRKHALKRISSQVPQSEKLAKADFVINNEDNLEHLGAEVNKVIKSLGLHE